jgi:hypothetical protein
MFEILPLIQLPLFPKPMTQAKAEKLGLVTFIGKPCPHGHRTRYTKTGQCAECHRARVHKVYHGEFIL